MAFTEQLDGGPVSATEMAPTLSEPVARQTKTFHYFPGLPAEIRVKIWHEALPGPRLVEVFYHHTLDKTLSKKPIIRVARTNTPSPGTLTACRESRYEILKTYIPIAHCPFTRCYPYFDPAKDTIFIHLPTFEDGTRKICKCCFPEKQQNIAAFAEYLTELQTNVRFLAMDFVTARTFWEDGKAHKFQHLEKIVTTSSYTGQTTCFWDRGGWMNGDGEDELIKPETKCDLQDVGMNMKMGWLLSEMAKMRNPELGSVVVKMESEIRRSRHEYFKLCRKILDSSLWD